MHEPPLENPYQSPVDAEAEDGMSENEPDNPFQSPIEGYESNECSPEFGLPEFAGTVAVSTVGSVWAFNLHPLIGALVVWIFVATIARTWVVVNRRHQTGVGRRTSAPTIFAGSFFLMTVLIVASLAVAMTSGTIVSGVLTPLISHGEVIVYRWTAIAGGVLGGLISSGIGFWVLLPKRVTD